MFCFSVSDTGIGMTSEFLAHIYEPFAQEGDDARSKFQGTGIGMSIVKSLIDMMGGTIEISSEVGVGSAFNVQIPLEIDKNPQAKERTDEQAYSCSLADMNVLLAEDNELNAEIAQALLESEGIVVTRAADGNETVDLYVGRPAGSFDAILMDIMMPVMDGIEAMVEIRKISNVPVILLTAKSEDTDKVLGLTVGADDYVTKPFNPVELQARVKSQIRRYMLLGAGNTSAGKLVIGGIELDDKSKTVTVDGEAANLTRTEYDILKLLMEHPGEVYSPNQIYAKVWKDEPYGTENTVAVHIRHLREKVEINPAEPRYLKVIWGRGYKIDAE